MHSDLLPPAAPPDDPVTASAQTLARLADNAEYIHQRMEQMDVEVQQAEQTVQQMQALARQLRSLASNTALEATRMQLGGPLAEIARQMRRLSQRMSETNDHLAVALRSHAVATGDLRQAGETLLLDARSVRPDQPRSMPVPDVRGTRSEQAASVPTSPASGMAGARPGRADRMDEGR